MDRYGTMNHIRYIAQRCKANNMSQYEKRRMIYVSNQARNICYDTSFLFFYENM